MHPGSRRFGAAVAFLQFLFPATACILSCSNNCCLEVDWKDSTTNAWHCIQKSSFQHAAVLVYAGMTAYRCTHPGVDDAICSTTPVSAFLEGLLGLRQGDAEHLLDVKLSSSPSDSSLMWLLVGFLCGAVQRQASCLSRDCCSKSGGARQPGSPQLRDRLGKETAERLVYTVTSFGRHRPCSPWREKHCGSSTRLAGTFDHVGHFMRA